MKQLLRITILTLTLTLLLLASASLTARASEHIQLPQFSTPTPGADGRIMYTVQAGDSCYRIEALTGVPVAQLRTLNPQLDENCTLTIGQQLMIGMGGPAGGGTPTAEASNATATPAQASPTPVLGDASVCVSLYEDVNGDTKRQDTEVTIPNGAVSVTGTSGQYSETANTVSGIASTCFEKVIPGTYNISVAAPEGYNSTSRLNYTLEIKTKEQFYVNFGAQKGGEAKPQDPASEPGSNNWLGIAGGVLLLAGLGLGLYAWRVYGRGPSSNLRRPPSGY
jgi:hypothetical protein